MTDMILFDVDGVLLSEERYFDASALTVWELIHGPAYLGLEQTNFTPAPEEALIRRVRYEVFANDRVLHLLKERGINANWDMVYFSFACQLIGFLQVLADRKPHDVSRYLEEPLDEAALQELGEQLKTLEVAPDYTALLRDFEQTNASKQQLLTYLNTVAENKTGIATSAFSRNSALWDVCQQAFQEWYLGDEKLDRPPRQKGKKGFLADEIPVVASDRLKPLFSNLNEKGITLGLGTGRPEIETIEPLKALGVLDYFDKKRIVTAQDVLDTERAHPDRSPLSKPRPFTYVYGRLGKDRSPEDVMDTPLPLKDAERLLIVGDSPADYYAAERIGARFAVVLTGLAGQAARSQFEQLGADYILDDVCGVADII